MHDEGELLLQIARFAIAEKLGNPLSKPEIPDELTRHGACFVTLSQHGQLRGCIGTLEAHRALHLDASENAQAAAFSDPRFAPLSKKEYDSINIEVSLLSNTEPLEFDSEQHALQQLRPHADGVVLQLGYRRSTFLPQVWESLPEPAEFIRHLKYKAGINPDFWSTDIRLSRYSVQKFRESK